ncbi:MAG: adenylate/guanylate cyclase domain-containing protein [Chthoniobacterales bacterium]
MAPESENNLRLEIGHVLFIDLVGYSMLLIEEQKERLGQLTDIVLATAQVREAPNEQLIRLPTGDGMALVFRNSSEEPAQCALEIAQALKAHPGIAVRMGIHSGPVSEVSDVSGRTNIAGAGINMAQRVMDCGDAGHILLSQRVADDLAQYRQWSSRLHDLGECEVKHGVRLHVFNLYTEALGNPLTPEKFKKSGSTKRAEAKQAGRTKKAGRPGWRRRGKTGALRWLGNAAVVLLLAGIVFWLFRARSVPTQLGDKTAASPAGSAPTAKAPEKSIAVLPFENRSEDKTNAYFADGIQDEVLTRLSKIADLKVISRTSTLHYKSAPENLTEIARQLGVANVVEGSVQKSGNSVRVNVQLIKAANDSHLWADTFDRKLTDIFSVETEVAKAIADQLQAKLTGQEEEILAAKPTDNPEAYDAYLRGLAYDLRNTGTPAGFLGAQKYLREAVQLDPKFALAWALLSRVEASGYLSLLLQPTVALREEARQAAQTALTLEPNLGEALQAMGYFHYALLKDYDTAERYYEQARQFLPNSSLIPESLALVAEKRGHWDRSESYFHEAERLDPRNANLLSRHAISYFWCRRFPESLRKLDQVLDIIPDDVDILAAKANIAQAEGDLQRAAAILAPLRPTANLSGALEVQIYQAILERRPVAVIPRLKEILAQPDPALGYVNGELRFWLGWAQEVAGDQAAAQETWREARSELEHFLKEQPENFQLLGDLALTNMGLGDKATALAQAERGMALNPIEKDSLVGPLSIDFLARVAARTGEHDRAIAALGKLLSKPGSGALAESLPLTPALLRLDPMFDSLRNDPRFQKLASDASQSAMPAMPTFPEKSIAVLPFENLSANQQNGFFADGVQDEILTDLAKVADLKVISRTSVINYRQTSGRNLGQIGQELGVAHVLEGSVQRAGNRVRVMAATLDRVLTVKPDDAETKAAPGMVDLDWKAETRPLHQAIDEIRARSPAAVNNIADYWFTLAMAERDPAAAADALIALGDIYLTADIVELRPSFCAGLVPWMTNEDAKAPTAFAAAREEERKIVQAQPDYDPACCVLALIDAGLGRKDEALAEGRRAVELLPVTKDSINGFHIIEYFAVVAAWVGEKDLACEQLARAVALPGYGLDTYRQLKLRPFWGPLRGYPRFEKIVANLAPKDT